MGKAMIFRYFSERGCESEHVTLALFPVSGFMFNVSLMPEKERLTARW